MKSAENRLAPRSDLATLGDLMNCGVLLLDGDGQLKFASAGACRLLDHETAVELRSEWPAVATRLDLQRLHLLEKDAPPLRYTIDFPTATDVRLLRLEAHVLRHGRQVNFMVLLKDRSLVDHYHQQLLLASQMTSQPYLIDALVHDMNAPINNMQLTLELMQSGLKSEGADANAVQRLQRYRNVLKEEVQRLNRLIKALPEALSPPDATLRPFDLRVVIEDVMGRLRHEAAARQIRRTISLPPQALNMRGASSRLKLAFFNLTLALQEAIRSGGSFALGVADLGRAASVTLSADIPVEARERLRGLQQMFLTADAQSPSLFVARTIIEAQGGDLCIDDVAGRPLAFRITLPLDHSMNANFAAEKEPGNAAASGQ